MAMHIKCESIGYVRGGRIEPTDDHWGEVTARIELDSSRFSKESLAGLESFSHLMVLYHFHQVPESKVEFFSRHPRNNAAWPKVGIFAQRAKDRPNRIGVSICDIIKVENTWVWVKGLDAIDGTPILDLKPFMKGFEPQGEVREPQWAREIMTQYW